MALVTRLLTSAVPIQAAFSGDSNRGGPNRPTEYRRGGFRSERPTLFIPRGGSAEYALGKATPGGHVKHH